MQFSIIPKNYSIGLSKSRRIFCDVRAVMVNKSKVVMEWARIAVTG